MAKYENIMVDCESLGPFADSVILSIAIIPFNLMEKTTMKELVDRGLYLKLRVKDQIESGRFVCKDTLQWWRKQSPEAQEILKPSPSDVRLESALDIIIDYLEKLDFDKKKGFVHCRGIQFDFPLVQNAYRTLGRLEDMPFNSWNLHDTKTFIRTLTCDKFANYTLDDPSVMNGYHGHNALHDAALEILKVNEILEKYYDPS